MGNSDAALAVVVSTRNRGNRLGRFFEAWRGVRYGKGWELVIVDNGSTDDTLERLREFAASFGNRVIILTEPTPGLSRAHNKGWRAASAPLVAFTDDDCYPEADYLQTVEAVFADESLGFAGGRILLYDKSDAPVTINETAEERFLDPRTFVPAGFIQGANMMFRRQTLEEIGGFDEGVGSGTPFVCGDIDAALRALAAGWKGKHDPRPVVYHHHGRKPGAELGRLFDTYDVGRGAYYMKCLLYLPQRWSCAGYWLKEMAQHHKPGRIWREFQAAGRYLVYQRKVKPNAAF